MHNQELLFNMSRNNHVHNHVHILGPRRTVEDIYYLINDNKIIRYLINILINDNKVIIRYLIISVRPAARMFDAQESRVIPNSR